MVRSKVDEMRMKKRDFQKLFQQLLDMYPKGQLQSALTWLKQLLHTSLMLTPMLLLAAQLE